MAFGLGKTFAGNFTKSLKKDPGRSLLARFFFCLPLFPTFQLIWGFIWRASSVFLSNFVNTASLIFAQTVFLTFQRTVVVFLYTYTRRLMHKHTCRTGAYTYLHMYARTYKCAHMPFFVLLLKNTCARVAFGFPAEGMPPALAPALVIWAILYTAITDSMETVRSRVCCRPWCDVSFGTRHCLCNCFLSC